MGTVNDDDARWDLVATWLEREIQEQGLTLRRIETEGKVAYRTVQKLLDGEGVARRDALARLATYLGYRADAFDRLLRGVSPVPIDTDGEIDLNSAAVGLTPEERRNVLEYIQNEVWKQDS